MRGVIKDTKISWFSGMGSDSKAVEVKDSDGNTQLKPGSPVWVDGLPGRYSVIEGPNRKGEYCVDRSGFAVWVAVEKLSVAEPSTKKNKGADVIRRSSRSKISVEHSRGAAPSASLTVDLHRLTVAEAIAAVESAIDDAILRDLDWFEIVHGRGSGKVRAAVHKLLAAAPQVKRFMLVPGNEGATKVYL